MNIYLIIAYRVVTIMLVLLLSILIIYGKRPIGELPVFDFLTILVIGAITGADIAQPDMPHLHIIFAIIITFLFQRLINIIYLKSYLFRKATTFHPLIVVQDGKLIYKTIKKAKFSADEILMLLREKDIFDIGDVKYGILESSGVITVLRNDYAETVTKKDLNINPMEDKLKLTVIMDGHFEDKNIYKLTSSQDEILKLINEQGYYDISEIFYACMDKNKNIIISPYTIINDF